MLYKGADSLHLLKTADKYIVLDTESTGFQPHDVYSKLIEISAIKIHNALGAPIIDHYSELINPGIKIPAKITEITGIRNEDVSGKRDYNAVLFDFYKFCDEPGIILIGHNIEHDMKFIQHFAGKSGLEFTQPYIDTMELAKQLLPKEVVGKYSLAHLCEYFGIEDKNHHRADNDAYITYKLFLELKKLAEDAPDVCKVNPESMKSYENNFVSSYYIRSVQPWVKKVTGSRWVRRIYVELRAKKDNKTETATVFFDYDKNQWETKETTFVIQDFSDVQKKVSKFMDTLPGMKINLCKLLDESGWKPRRRC